MKRDTEQPLAFTTKILLITVGYIFALVACDQLEHPERNLPVAFE
jgi:hypothetical protein